ncbi:MAG: hypothetical protein F9K43_25820, partial [Bauldia sp.]
MRARGAEGPVVEAQPTPRAGAKDLVFLSLAGAASRGSPDGIYVRALAEESAPWTLVERGSFRDLALASGGGWLFANEGNFDRAEPRSRVVAWALAPEGLPSGPRRALDTETRGQVRKIAPSPSGAGLFAEIALFEKGYPYGRSAIFSMDNETGRPARLVARDLADPSLSAPPG